MILDITSYHTSILVYTELMGAYIIGLILDNIEECLIYHIISEPKKDYVSYYYNL